MQENSYLEVKNNFLGLPKDLLNSFKTKKNVKGYLNIHSYDVTKDTINFDSIGKKIDSYIIDNFQGENIVARAISCMDNNKLPYETMDEILKHGTDEVSEREIFGAETFVTYGMQFAGEFLKQKYMQDSKKLEKPEQVDLITIYNSEFLTKTGKFNYSFKKEPTKALLGVIRLSTGHF